MILSHSNSAEKKYKNLLISPRAILHSQCLFWLETDMIKSSTRSVKTLNSY